MTSRLIQSIIVDRSEIGQDNTGLPIFTLKSDDITDISETIVKQLSANRYSQVKPEVCEHLDRNGEMTPSGIIIYCENCKKLL